MSLRYSCGTEIQKGDHVLLSEEPGVIEIVADPSVRDPDTLWYVEEFGGGVMVGQLTRLGAVFIEEPELEEDLDFVGRAGGQK